MSNPIIKVSDIAFPRFQGPDLDVMEAYLTNFGMVRSARTDEALYMRGTDADHHVHVTHLGEVAFIGLTFNATRADLETLSQATGTPIEKCTEPGGGLIVRLTDPDGNRVEVIADAERLAPLEVRPHAAYNNGQSRPRAVELQRIEAGPSQVKRFGHGVIKTTSLARLVDWYSSTLGLLGSDDMYVEDPEQPIGRFMRCDRGDTPTDHHSLLILETGETRLGHCAWEVADFDDLMAGREPLLATGARHYWGVGRHILGGQIFDYWKDPLGFTLEHWTDTDLLVASTPLNKHSIFAGINQWGPNPPADLDF